MQQNLQQVLCDSTINPLLHTVRPAVDPFPNIVQISTSAPSIILDQIIYDNLLQSKNQQGQQQDLMHNVVLNPSLQQEKPAVIPYASSIQELPSINTSSDILQQGQLQLLLQNSAINSSGIPNQITVAAPSTSHT